MLPRSEGAQASHGKRRPPVIRRTFGSREGPPLLLSPVRIPEPQIMSYGNNELFSVTEFVVIPYIGNRDVQNTGNFV